MDSINALMSDVERLGAFTRQSHVVYTNGHHSREHLNWAMVLTRPDLSKRAARLMAQAVAPYEFETVVGPTHTGDKIARDLMFALQESRSGITCVYAEEEKIIRSVRINGKWVKAKVDTGQLFFPRKQELLVVGKRVVIVDDVLTTGGTIKKTREAVLKYQGKPSALAVIYNISDIRDTYLGFPFLALVNADMEFWEEVKCVACKEGVPINTTVNKHGRDFLTKYGPDPKNWPANKAA